MIAFGLRRSRLITVVSRATAWAYLKEDGILRLSPEVRHRVATVALAWLHLQSTRALSVGTGLVLLLLTSLVADGRSQVDLLTILEDTVSIAQ